MDFMSYWLLSITIGFLLNMANMFDFLPMILAIVMAHPRRSHLVLDIISLIHANEKKSPFSVGGSGIKRKRGF